MSNDKFQPVILSIVDGLGLNYWEMDSCGQDSPLLFLLNSEAEEASATLTLLKSKYKNVLVEKTYTRKSRGAALAFGLRKAKELSFTHAITIENIAQNKEAIETLLRNGAEHPDCLIYQNKNDTRRLYPLSETVKIIEEMNLGLGFEREILTLTPKKNLHRVSLSGKPEKPPFIETLYASLLGLIKH